MISQEEAEAIAARFMESKNQSSNLTFELVRVWADARMPGFWTATVQYYNSSGGPIDGPVMVSIDMATGEACFARSLWSRRVP
jgi:hypothetical protein